MSLIISDTVCPECGAYLQGNGYCANGHPYVEGKIRFSVSAETRLKAAFLILEAIFFTMIVLISGNAMVIPPVLQPLFALAVFRAARTISFNEIGEIWRAPFTEVKQDSCGAGANVHPKGEGFRYAIGALISCPICSGTWAALVLYAAYVFFQPIGITLISVLGFAGAHEMLHWGGETLEWTGRMTRVIAGVISPDEE